MSTQQLAEELHKSIVRKFERRKVHSSFIGNVVGADLADVQLISKFNKRIHFLLCFIGIFSKYAWVVHLKNEKGIAIIKNFQKFLDKSGHKPNKIWVETKYTKPNMGRSR